MVKNDQALDHLDLAIQRSLKLVILNWTTGANYAIIIMHIHHWL